MIKWSTVDTPAGPFCAVVDADGVVLASGWTAYTDDLLPQVAPSLMFETLVEAPDLGPVTRAVTAYHEGDLEAIDDIPVNQSSGPYLQHAWKVLRTVAPGKLTSYAEFASLTGKPRAVRAAASACSRNAVALFVPCHRIVRSDGSVGEFRWGPDRKKWLLHHERTHS
ncbi:methylated-DNA--[protein]-cysteine S-methyltransferase [Saccharopolyspora flava]|uniref:Methylated-DNA-[protein]-cysteine S-methyltransferase n=1 Tax=Saccharopolyspora flava TaxID=95161 RepID=A0A1I6QPV7_9PSEU|nr:methylated-DNA--[protein]-cysteine S-methyltransferase [Saccharopolyspora flava]SFS54392.1 methylated-DNA-[protein]-cysteine S-methyltransferase [Saccharopolyspora flava]